VIKHGPEKRHFLKDLIPCLHFSKIFKNLENLGGVKSKHLLEIQNTRTIIFFFCNAPQFMTEINRTALHNFVTMVYTTDTQSVKGGDVWGTQGDTQGGTQGGTHGDEHGDSFITGRQMFHRWSLARRPT
jgi:hypothetical protein